MLNLKENTISPIKKEYSLLVWAAIAVFYIASFHYYQNWKSGLSGGDPCGYYVWLPSAFIYHDMTNPVKTHAARQKAFGQSGQLILENLGYNHPETAPADVYMNKYSMGLALMNAPFFATAHLLAPVLGYEADGFSMIYRYLIFGAALFYSIAGLFVLRKVLRNYLDNRATSWTLVAIALATNLYFFAVWNSGMSHATLFFLFACLLFYTEQWYRGQWLFQAVMVGFLCGFITLIRPTDAICVAIPLLYGLVSRAAVRARAQMLAQRWTHVVAAVTMAIVAGFPQLLYWKIHTGKFFYYSYGNEGFDFSNPHILQGLFEYQNGWLAYTPVMYLALAGIVRLLHNRNYLWPVLVVLPVQIWVIYSFWCWQWVNGFGARPMVQHYALLSIPLGLFMAYVLSGKWLKWPVIAFALLCVAVNITQAWQFDRGLIWTELGNRQFYFSTLFKSKLSSNDLLYFDGAPKQPDPAKLTLIKNLYHNNYEDSTSVQYIRGEGHEGQFGFRCNRENEFSPGYHLDAAGNTLRPGQWLKVRIWCMRRDDSGDLYKMSKLVCTFIKNGDPIEYCGIRLDNKPGNTDGSLWSGKRDIWEDVIFYMPVPKQIDDKTALKVYVWNPNEPAMYLDNLSVDLYE